jgi:acyl-coenzyme A synthetase/AMP-(fatty) acid ligase
LKEGKLVADVVGNPKALGALAEIARERLAPEAVPKHFYLVPQLPRTPNGKLLRH